MERTLSSEQAVQIVLVDPRHLAQASKDSFGAAEEHTLGMVLWLIAGVIFVSGIFGTALLVWLVRRKAPLICSGRGDLRQFDNEGAPPPVRHQARRRKLPPRQKSGVGA